MVSLIHACHGHVFQQLSAKPLEAHSSSYLRCGIHGVREDAMQALRGEAGCIWPDQHFALLGYSYIGACCFQLRCGVQNVMRKRRPKQDL